MPMPDSTPAIEIHDLTYAYGRAEAVRNLNLTVARGKCYGLFGRNGAGKTTTMKCLLNLLRPQHGSVSIFGVNPTAHEVEVKSRLAYVPDQVALYPWMTIREMLDYLASFRDRWNRDTEQNLLERFRLDPVKRTDSLSKGQRTQVALIAAVCPETELLVLDEPTSGLDPIIRREFIETIIGAYQEGDPGNRTIFVSTHLISEFEGLIDEFSIIDAGRTIVTMNADDARDKYKRIRARYASDAPDLDLRDALHVYRQGRELEVVANGSAAALEAKLRETAPEHIATETLTLEEIFVATLRQ